MRRLRRRPAAFPPIVPSILALVALAALVPVALNAQDAPDPVRSEIAGQFESAARRTVALAEAMPAGSFGWSPGEGVQTVAAAYMHIARYNYLYPEQNLGVAPPDGLDYADWEETVTEKERVVELLEASMDHVRSVLAGMSDGELVAETTLYGRTVPRWAVLLQLVTHMNQHLGQEIAYARMNGVTPPWSR